MTEAVLLPSFSVLSLKDKGTFHRIILEASLYISQNETDHDPIFIEISECPNEQLAFAIERYMIDMACWKHCGFIADEKATFLVLSAVDRSPFS